jgi:RND superfamily putative drug exporter
MIGIPIALLILLLSFGTLVAAIVPLLIGVLSVLTTMGLLQLLAGKMELSIYVLNVVPMVGLALGIDFALLYINRFREELKNRPVPEAIAVTNQTAGRSVIFSGLCVFLGLTGMLFIQADIFKSVAIGGMFVVFLSVLGANTFLPAVLGILGHRVNKGRIFKVREDRISFWSRISSFVMKRAPLVLFSSVLLLVIAASPVRHISFNIPNAEALPDGYDSKEAYLSYASTFTNKDESQIVALVKFGGDYTKLADVTNELKSLPLVKDVTSILSLSGTKDASSFNPAAPLLKPLVSQLTYDDTALVKITLDGRSSSSEVKNWMRSAADRSFAAPITFGGYPKFQQEIFDEIGGKIGYSIALVLVATYLILMFAFKSIIIPLKAIFMNVLSMAAAFGVLVWIFQYGHFGIEPTDIALIIPVFTFGIAFGLSTDYEVFLVSRIYESYLETGDNDRATFEGLASTSKIITSAALIMIVVTGAFAFTGIVPVKQMGLAIAISILIDATIIRLLLVPSLMKLLGKWNWYMPFNKKQ